MPLPSWISGMGLAPLLLCLPQQRREGSAGFSG